MNKRQTILYAEDESTDAFFLERALRRAGVPQRLIVVPHGQAAIDYLTKITHNARDFDTLPALVLLDVNMPGLSGFDVLEWIRAMPGLESLVTLMFSSSEHPSDVRRAYALEANGYLVKPCTLEEAVTMAKQLKDHWLRYDSTLANSATASPSRASSEQNTSQVII
jgi:CheY-like chemotaxis protein